MYLRQVFGLLFASRSQNFCPRAPFLLLLLLLPSSCATSRSLPSRVTETGLQGTTDRERSTQRHDRGAEHPHSPRAVRSERTLEEDLTVCSILLERSLLERAPAKSSVYSRRCRLARTVPENTAPRGVPARAWERSRGLWFKQCLQGASAEYQGVWRC